MTFLKGGSLFCGPPFLCRDIMWVIVFDDCYVADIQDRCLPYVDICQFLTSGLYFA